MTPTRDALARFKSSTVGNQPLTAVFGRLRSRLVLFLCLACVFALAHRVLGPVR